MKLLWVYWITPVRSGLARRWLRQKITGVELQGHHLSGAEESQRGRAGAEEEQKQNRSRGEQKQGGLHRTVF